MAQSHEAITCTSRDEEEHRSLDEGAIVSEFSSTSRDEFDVFTDPRIKRIPEIVEA